MTMMHLITGSKRRTAAALTAVGLMLAAGTALAAQEEITVTTPRGVTRQEIGRTATGAPIEQISISHRVWAGDLNLSSAADIDELHQRVREVARRSCAELDRLYPEAAYPSVDSSNQDCMKSAMDSAIPQMHAMIAMNARY